MTQSVFKQALYRTALPFSLGICAFGSSLPAFAQITQTSTNSTASLSPDSPFRDPDIIYLEADELINDEELRILTASGEVEGRYQSRTLRADSVVYNLDTGAVVATGNVILVDASGAS